MSIPIWTIPLFLVVGWAVGRPALWVMKAKAELYENLFKKEAQEKVLLQLCMNEEIPNAEIPELVELAWIVYCDNKNCHEYGKGILMAIVVPPEVVGHEQGVEIHCTECDQPLLKISDPTSYVS